MAHGSQSPVPEISDLLPLSDCHYDRIQHRTRHRTGFCAKCLRSYRNNATCVRPACERTCDKRSRGGGDHQRRVVHRGLPDNSSHLLPLSCALISLCFVCEIEKREGRSGIDPVNQS